ncbi:MAG TPA: hydrolase [Terracidiphilus sp.]|nr:hydrolase [Terracidiphilus sp.]
MELILDPHSTALVLIDLQHGITMRETAPHAAADVVARAAQLAATVRGKGGTVIYVRVLGSEFLQLPTDVSFPRPSGPMPPNVFEIVPESGIQPTDIVVTKRQWGAFYGTDLEQHLRRRRIQTIILGGIATHIGVESTARAAFDQGFELVFAEDAMTSLSAEVHAFPVAHVFPRMGRVRSTAQIIAALQ